MSRGKRRYLLLLVGSPLCMCCKTRERQTFYRLCEKCERGAFSEWMWSAE